MGHPIMGMISSSGNDVPYAFWVLSAIVALSMEI
jgi:hypothetical protein